MSFRHPSIGSLDDCRNHRNRDHQISPGAQFQKRRRGIFQPPRNQHSSQNFIRPTQRSSISGNKQSEGDSPSTYPGCQLDFRIQRQERRHSIRRRRRVTQVPCNRTPILNLHRADFARSRLERIKATRQGSADHFRPGRQAADPKMVTLNRDSPKLIERRDIDDIALRQPLAQRRIKIRSAGQNLSSGRGQHGDSLIQCSWLEIQGLGPRIPHRRSLRQFVYEGDAFVQRSSRRKRAFAAVPA